MNLINFVVKAKFNTYAQSKPVSKVKLSDGSTQLTFEEGSFRYVDRYYGTNPFSGEEVVFKNGKFIWSMNYYGLFTCNLVSEKKGVAFLKKALRTVSKKTPFRGVHRFEEGNFLYTMEFKGNFDVFSGLEKIFFKRKEIYRLLFHGGQIKK